MAYLPYRTPGVASPLSCMAARPSKCFSKHLGSRALTHAVPLKPFNEGGNRLTLGGHPNAAEHPECGTCACQHRETAASACAGRGGTLQPLLPVQGAAVPSSGIRPLPGAGLPLTLLHGRLLPKGWSGLPVIGPCGPRGSAALAGAVGLPAESGRSVRATAKTQRLAGHAGMRGLG
jgi:hypothetical protein